MIDFEVGGPGNSFSCVCRSHCNFNTFMSQDRPRRDIARFDYNIYDKTGKKVLKESKTSKHNSKSKQKSKQTISQLGKVSKTKKH